MWLIHSSTCLPRILWNWWNRSLKQSILTRQRDYPHLIYLVASLISSLQGLISRQGFLDKCEHWRATFFKGNDSIQNVYDDKIWESFMEVNGCIILSEPNSLFCLISISSNHLSIKCTLWVCCTLWWICLERENLIIGIYNSWSSWAFFDNKHLLLH